MPHMKIPIVSSLDVFVSIRFWLLLAFVSIYYFQMNLTANFLNLRRFLLMVLLVIIGLAVPANYMWIVDYKRRLTSGIKFLKTQTGTLVDGKETLEQIRWANAKLLAVVALILAILSHYNEISAIPFQHRIPVLTTALLILVALFDSALDLEAEWTISLLASTKLVDANGKESGTLAKAIWKTNQFKDRQNELYENVGKVEEPNIKFGSFSSTAQNVISFAVIIVFYLAVSIFNLLWTQLRDSFT